MRQAWPITGLALAAGLSFGASGWALHRAFAAQGMSVPAASVDLSQYPTRSDLATAIAAVPTYSDAKAKAAAPVQSVNGAQGQVAVPTVQRQVSSALDASAGTVTWPFPSAFTNQPTCWESLATTNANFSYDAPIVTAISKTSVSVKLSAHPSSLSITGLGLPIALPLTGNPPSGTTVTLSCVGALP